ncbi:MAG: Gfo/Idh/MocA family oxidoreductase [Acidobacteria bacterium]|nr:Gfo/Idh/MocA family oxidoreductase [Acidobacteriota bacterium]
MDSRRTFVLGAGAAALSQVAKPKLYGANDRIRIATLGVHGRGNSHINGFGALPGVEVAVLCDPDAELLAKQAAKYQEKYGHKFETETDLRKVFERKDIDAVSIATPNHWHALAAIWACQAGKDVYVEKPGCHNVFEGRKLIEAAHKYNRIVQHGVQLRSSEAVQEAIGHLRKGVIGNVYMARGLVFRWRPSIGKKPAEAPPSTLNWDIWQGPAQERPFSRNIVHYNWHWNWTYGNGDVGNQGIHETDLCMWGLGVDKLPSKITAMGGKFLFDDDKETPETLSSTYLFAEENKMIEFEVRPWATNSENGVGVGNIFYGSDGYMVVKGYDQYETFVNQGKEKGPSRKAGGDHFANFIKAVRSRKTADQNGPVETVHLSSSLAHLGNIAYRLNRQLSFDPKTERFVGDEQANALLTRQYRAPYVVPEKV